MALATRLKTRPGLLQLDRPDTPADRVAEKRRIRKHQVLDVVRRHGPIPRVDIARILGFNLPSVSSLVDELVSEDLALEEKAKKTAIGRRPIPVQLNAGAACVLGVDLGKSSTIGLIMNLGGSILGRLEHPSPANLAPENSAAWLEHFIEEMVEIHGTAIPPLAGVGIALPGLIWKTRGPAGDRLEPQAEQISRIIGGMLEVPVLIDNDARMMAYGVMRFGNATGIENFVIVNLGYGLGTGIVLNGEIYRGNFGHAGELGHLPLGDRQIKWSPGVDGSLENVASGAGLERMAALAGLKHGGQVMNAAQIAEAARKGSKPAREVFGRFSTQLGQGLASLMHLFNPHAVILAGRVSRAADVFEEQLLAEIRRATLPAIFEETQIIVSDLHENAGPLGTCSCVLQHIYSAAHIPVESIV